MTGLGKKRPKTEEGIIYCQFTTTILVFLENQGGLVKGGRNLRVHLSDVVSMLRGIVELRCVFIKSLPIFNCAEDLIHFLCAFFFTKIVFVNFGD